MSANQQILAALGGKQQFLVFVNSNSPYIQAYEWSDATGFGAKYSAPATLPAGLGFDVEVSPDGSAILMANQNTPSVTAYAWSKNGFGAKYADPATAPSGGGTRAVSFSPSGDTVMVGSSSSPRINAYPWSKSSGFGTRYSAPATVPQSNLLGISFRPAGDVVACVFNSSPYVAAYPWSGSGFGTKFSDPATTPDFAQSCMFSKGGGALLVGVFDTPFAYAYAWSSGFGALYSGPSSAGSGGQIEDIAFAPDNSSVLLVNSSNSVTIPAYAWSDGSGFGSARTAAPSGFPGFPRGAAFSPSGKAVAVTHNCQAGDPQVSVFAWTASGFGNKYADPTVVGDTGSTSGKVTFGEL
jgi:hypothetical protein